MNKPLLAPSMINTPGQPLPPPAPGGEAGSMTPPILVQYWTMARRWKLVIIAIMTLAVLGGVLATLLATPQYTAATQIEISRDQQNVTNVEGLEPEAARQDQEFYQTQYTLLQSRSLAERVARQLNLGNNVEFWEAHGLANEGSENLDQRARLAQAANVLLGNVEVLPISRSRLIDIEYTSASPDISARIANTWAQQFIQASMDRRFASTADAREFLEGRLAELAQRVQESERTLVNFASEKGIVALSTERSADGRTAVDRTLVSADLEALNSALADAIADRVSAQAAVGSGAGEAEIQNASIGSLRQRRAELQSEYSRLMVQFEPGYPAARALQEQIGSLDAAIAREERRVGSSRQTAYNEAVRREAGLRARVEALKGRLDQQSRDYIQYNIYQRDADTNRQLYDSLLQRYKEIGVAGVAANNIAIVDQARAPGSPSSPSLINNLLIAIILGAGLAGLVVLALEQIDEGLRDPADVKRLLELPLLGSVPDLEEDNPIELLADPKSQLSEAYLSVRSNLAFSTDHGVPRSLIVTSSRPSEGKSTTAYALAVVLSRTSNRTILIDADMRSPSIHSFAGGNNDRGLSNFLAGDKDWASLVQTDAAGGRLHYLPAGPMPPSAAELLSSERMTQLLAQLADHYDHVVIDSPPLLGLADAPLLASSVEGVVFVVESGGVAVRGLRAALGRLRMAHAHIFGVVLTKLHAQSGFGYGYGYGYTYGDNDGNKVAADAR